LGKKVGAGRFFCSDLRLNESCENLCYSLVTVTKTLKMKVRTHTHTYIYIYKFNFQIMSYYRIYNIIKVMVIAPSGFNFYL